MNQEDAMMNDPGSEAPLSRPAPLDPEKPLFPGVEGSPTYADLANWKRQYGAHEIFTIRINHQPFVYRTLTRLEYKDIMRSQEADQMAREEATVQRCLLWPSDYRGAMMNAGRAGWPTILAEQIMECSGFMLGGAPEQL